VLCALLVIRWLTIPRLKDPESSWLVFDGLDTFTTIELCGQFIANTDNQFRQYTFDVSDVLKQCQSDPVLSINFGSAPQIANAIADEPGAPG
jgi:beta-mannosidase